MIDDLVSSAFASAIAVLGRTATLHLGETVQGAVTVVIGAPAPALTGVATVEAAVSQGTIQVMHTAVAALLAEANRDELRRGDVFAVASGPQAGNWRVNAARQVDGGIWVCAVTHAKATAVGAPARRLS